MNSFRRFLLTSILLSISSNAWSQQAEICNAAFSSGIRDNYNVLTERERYSQYQHRLCDTQFDSYDNFQQSASSFELNIPVAEIIIGLEGNHDQKSNQFSEKYRKYCRSAYSQDNYRDRFISETSRVNEALAASWLACQRIHVDAWTATHNYGLFVSASVQDNFSEFTILVNRRTAVVDPIVITDISPAGGLQCHRGGEAFEPGVSIDRREFTFTCSKFPNQSLQVVLDTSDGTSNSIKIPSRHSKIAELNDKILKLNSVILQQKNFLLDEIKGLRSNLSSVGNSTEDITQEFVRSGQTTWTGTSRCSDGEYVVGFVGKDNDDGGYCYNCINQFKVICRKIK